MSLMKAYMKAFVGTSAMSRYKKPCERWCGAVTLIERRMSSQILAMDLKNVNVICLHCILNAFHPEF